MSNRQCYQCSNTVTRDNTNVIYCDICYDQRKNDICEYIDSTGISHYVTKSNLASFPQMISSHPYQIRLDLQGVLDLISPDVVFKDPNMCCCISFVGSTTQTRNLARSEILSRLGKQIKCGFLVFKRGRGKHENKFHDAGGKAWINSLLPLNPSKAAIFIDDSEDHIYSVTSKAISGLSTHLMTKHDDLVNVIDGYF